MISVIVEMKKTVFDVSGSWAGLVFPAPVVLDLSLRLVAGVKFAIVGEKLCTSLLATDEREIESISICIRRMVCVSLNCRTVCCSWHGRRGAIYIGGMINVCCIRRMVCVSLNCRTVCCSWHGRRGAIYIGGMIHVCCIPRMFGVRFNCRMVCRWIFVLVHLDRYLDV